MKEPSKFEGQHHTTQKPFLWVRTRLLTGEALYEEERRRIMSLIFPFDEKSQYLHWRSITTNLWFASLNSNVPTLDAANYPAFTHIAEAGQKMRFVGFREQDKKTGEILRGWKILQTPMDYKKKLHKDIEVAGVHKMRNGEIAGTGLVLFPTDLELAELASQRDLLYAGHSMAGNPQTMNTSPYSSWDESPEDIVRVAKEELSKDKFKEVAKLFVKEIMPDFF